MNKTETLFIIGTIIVLSACSGSGSRYSISQDVAPDKPIKLEHIEDAHPTYEPFSRGGNKDYTLRGNSYQIIRTPEGFKQSGQASWYGQKFHGHLTSNGEIYDMYSMSAAHKTLPIPSYVSVVNKDNGRTAIVRINDRGPFHQGRIIDLSYAAAHKLGVISTGTANVEIAYITTKPPAEKPVEVGKPGVYRIQTASSNSADRSASLAKKISESFTFNAFVEQSDGIYKILVGPFNDAKATEQALEKLKLNGYPQAFIRKLPQ